MTMLLHISVVIYIKSFTRRRLLG